MSIQAQDNDSLHSLQLVDRDTITVEKLDPLLEAMKAARSMQNKIHASSVCLVENLPPLPGEPKCFPNSVNSEDVWGLVWDQLTLAESASAARVCKSWSSAVWSCRATLDLSTLSTDHRQSITENDWVTIRFFLIQFLTF
jgi:hypothetical protein